MEYISSPEFINLQPLDINPLMSKCEIKVMYVGENRNKTCITKEVAQNMAKTLRGCPIVGYYREDIEDFDDHGHRIKFTEDGVEFVTMTKPYGFVAPNARIWFQQIEDSTGFIRDYLMTEGYLWTSQFPECQSIIDNGKGQSMELDDNTMTGYWNTDTKFFIVNDATFSKLCILGDNVEPCFEDASINASKSYVFKQTLFSMMEDLKQVLGGNQMDEKLENVDEYVKDPKKEEEEKASAPAEEKKDAEKTSADAKEEDDKKKKKDYANEEADKKEKEKKKEEKVDEEDDYACNKKKKYELLESQLNDLSKKFDDLSSKFSLVNKEVEDLREYKRVNENIKKDKMIQEDFYMLSEEDKMDVIKNKENYSLDEIESKLSVIAVRNKVNFNKVEEKVEEAPATNFTLDISNEGNSIPAFIESMRKAKQQNSY